MKMKISCDCDQGDPCPQGKVGSGSRCVIWVDGARAHIFTRVVEVETEPEVRRERELLLQANNRLIGMGFDNHVRVTELERQRDDLHKANNELLERARMAEARYAETRSDLGGRLNADDIFAMRTRRG